MKRMISFIVLTLCVFASQIFAAESYVDRLNADLAGKEGVLYFNITKAMIQNFTENQGDSKHAKQLAKMSAGVEGIKLINIDIEKSKTGSDQIEAVTQHLNSSYKAYEVVMEMNVEGHLLKILSNEEEKDHMFFKIDKDNLLVINIVGEVNLVELMKASAMMGINVETMIAKHIKKAEAGE